MIGQTLAHYRITAALGAGGMGEVYRATDTKLGRDVAIKILPAEVAKDPARLERFQREAHLLAALNHPHIAAIHGLEEADGQPFLVLELVEGEDLRERLSRGPIPVDEALEIAQQVAEALEEAHNTGIVHRDLKPANVKVTPDGKVKVLDFGLAKAWTGDGAEAGSHSASMSQSPTLAHSGTQAGVILGTAAYMSPEQARGKPVDKRTDVWAFGVLLWEMLTGRTLFAGETVTDVIAAVVKEEPDLDALPVETPRAVRWLLARCLRKDPRTRLPDIGSARLTLQDVLGGTAPEAHAPADAAATLTGHPQRSRERWVWAAVSLLATAIAVTLAVVHWTEAPDPRPAVHFTVDAPEGWSLLFALPSPDGRHIVASARPDDGDARRDSKMAWLHTLESGTFRLLEGTEGVYEMFWSPDGRFIGFAADGELRRLSLEDGIMRRICVLPERGAIGADWNDEGTILFGGPEGLYTVPASGGDPERLLAIDPARDEEALYARRWLPGGRFLFDPLGRRGRRPVSLGVYLGSLDDPDERRLLWPDAARYVLAGRHVLFNREDTLFAQLFNFENAEVRGEPFAIASSVAFFDAERGRFAVSPEGTLLTYFTGEEEERVQLTWLDRKGELIETVGAPGLYDQIALSPDGRRVAVEVRGDEGWDLWTIDLARGVPNRLTSEPGNERDPVWSPDSQEVTYGSYETGNRGLGLFRKGLSGARAQPIPIGDEANAEFRPIPHSWSSDGKTLLYKRIGQNKGWAFTLEEAEEPEVLLDLDVSLNKLRVSPDGRWLAFTSQESGGWDVYVQPFRRSGERVRVSRSGGGLPRWRSDAKELFYQTPEGTLMAVKVGEGAAGPEVSPPTALLDAGSFRSGWDSYGVSADGQRFLVKKPVEGDRELQLHVIVNWESLLENER